MCTSKVRPVLPMILLAAASSAAAMSCGTPASGIPDCAPATEEHGLASTFVARHLHASLLDSLRVSNWAGSTDAEFILSEESPYLAEQGYSLRTCAEVHLGVLGSQVLAGRVSSVTPAALAKTLASGGTVALSHLTGKPKDVEHVEVIVSLDTSVAISWVKRFALLRDEQTLESVGLRNVGGDAVRAHLDRKALVLCVSSDLTGMHGLSVLPMALPAAFVAPGEPGYPLAIQVFACIRNPDSWPRWRDALRRTFTPEIVSHQKKDGVLLLPPK